MIPRFLIVIFMASLSFLATHSQNIFVEGTVWEYDVWNCGGPPDKMTCTLEKIDDVAGRECLGVFVDRSRDEGRSLEMVISTEGDKVYVYDDRATDDGSDPWQILYDFSLRPGDEASLMIYTIAPTSNWKPEFRIRDVAIECIDVRDPVDSHYLVDAEQMIIREYTNDDKTEHREDIVWTRGFGSNKGICSNLEISMFEHDDYVNPIMTRIINGDKVYYEFEPWGGDAIDGVVTDEPTFRVSGRNVAATYAGATISVYSTDGRIVADNVGRTTLPAPGVYVVKAAGRPHKIAVR